MAAKDPFRTILIAPSGMDCAICMAFLRKKNRCGGFPRRRLKQLDARYRAKYHMSMLENLAAIRKLGIRAFVKSDRERWTCKTCGGTIDVHQYRCSVCGSSRCDQRPILFCSRYKVRDRSSTPSHF